jgi:hypothetical protein
MVAAGVFPRGWMSPLRIAASVISSMLIALRDDFKIATAASR